MRFAVVYGSVREGRRGITAARFIVRKLEERGHDVDFIDPEEYVLPLLKKRYKDYEKGSVPEILEKLADIFRNSDGIVIVSAEYNHGFPAAGKNLLDHFLEEYFWKPSGIVSYSVGMYGGVRAAVHWRDTLCEMGMPSIPSNLAIGKVQDQFNEEGVPNDPETWDKRSKKFFDELEWYAEAMKIQREKGIPY